MNQDALPTALARLEQRLREWHAPIVDHLRPGADRTAVEQALRQIGVSATEEMFELWAWHDGTDAGAGPDGHFGGRPENLLIGGWHFMSLDDAVSTYRELRDSPDVEEFAPASWMPTLDFIDAPMLCAETDPSSRHHGALFIIDGHADLPAKPPRPLARSLLEFVGFLLLIFDAGAVIPNAPTNGGIDIDDSRLPAGVPLSAYL